MMRVDSSCSAPPCPRPPIVGIYPLPVPNSGIVPPWLRTPPVIVLPVVPDAVRAVGLVIR